MQMECESFPKICSFMACVKQDLGQTLSHFMMAQFPPQQLQNILGSKRKGGAGFGGSEDDEDIFSEIT